MGINSRIFLPHCTEVQKVQEFLFDPETLSGLRQARGRAGGCRILEQQTAKHSSSLPAQDTDRSDGPKL